MAIFKPGPALESISGNLGGVNFANTKGSKVVRQRIRRTKQTDPRHLENIARMQTVRDRWRRLSTDQRAAWEIDAQSTQTTNRLGQRAPQSGFQRYVNANMFMWRVTFPGGTKYSDFPLLFVPEDISMDLLLDFTAGGPYIVEGVDAAPGFIDVAFSIGRTFSTASRRSWNSFRLIDQAGTATGNPLDITTAFQSNIGDLIQGEQCFLRSRYIDTPLFYPDEYAASTHAK